MVQKIKMQLGIRRDAESPAAVRLSISAGRTAAPKTR
jgi:hypothetical protein